ncbi:MAG: hypothetical protein ACXWW0_13455 [Bacteroidia bacterium]
MKNFLILLFAFLLLSCEENKPDQQITEETPLQDSLQELDSLTWKDVKINGKISLITELKKVNSELGKTDSISVGRDECPDLMARDFANLFVKGIEFENRNDSLIFRSIDLRKSDIFLSSDQIRLDKTTTTEELQKYFPYSFTRESRKEIYGVGIVKSIEIKDTASDKLWLLFFDDKKLIRIEYWIGC